MSKMTKRYVAAMVVGLSISVMSLPVSAAEASQPQTARQQVVQESNQYATSGFVGRATLGYWTPLNSHMSGFQKALCWIVSVPAGIVGVLFGWFTFYWTLAPIKLLLQAPMEIFIDRVFGAVVSAWVAWAASYIFLGLKLIS